MFLVNETSEWLSDYSWIFSLGAVVLVVVILGILIAVLVGVKKTNRLVGRNPLKLSAKVAYDSDNMNEYLEISVFNCGLRDVNIKDFGLRYKNQTVSLINEFTERRASKSHSVDVATGSSLVYKLNPERVEKFVISHNFSATSIDPIYVICVDSNGNETVKKEVSLSRLFNARQKARLLQAKTKIHQGKIDEYKAGHEGNEPLTEGIYRLFHRKQIRIPELVAKADSLMVSDRSVNSKTVSDSSYAPAISDQQSESPAQTSSVPFGQRKMNTQEMKVTYLNMDPLKSLDETDEETKGH